MAQQRSEAGGRRVPGHRDGETEGYCHGCQVHYACITRPRSLLAQSIPRLLTVRECCRPRLTAARVQARAAPVQHRARRGRELFQGPAAAAGERVFPAPGPAPCCVSFCAALRGPLRIAVACAGGSLRSEGAIIFAGTRGNAPASTPLRLSAAAASSQQPPLTPSQVHEGFLEAFDSVRLRAFRALDDAMGGGAGAGAAGGAAGGAGGGSAAGKNGEGWHVFVCGHSLVRCRPAV